MVRRVLLARGGSLSITNGLGRAHNSIVSVLNRALVPNWTKVKVIEHQIVSNIFLSIFKRWKQHPKLVSEENAIAHMNAYLNNFESDYIFDK